MRLDYLGEMNKREKTLPQPRDLKTDTYGVAGLSSIYGNSTSFSGEAILSNMLRPSLLYYSGETNCF
jgi:hypothetical protein